jgi:hypothetical protein
MTKRQLFTASTVGVVCALAGASAGIAESSASTQHPKTDSAAVGWAEPSGRSLGLGAFDAIHSESVEPTANGGFDTVTVDAGTITAVGTSSLTITEGSSRAVYARPTITPQGTVTVTLDGKPSTLSALTAGDPVIIAQSSAGTTRIAALKPASTSTSTSTSTSSGWNGGPASWGPDQPTSGWGGYGPASGWSSAANRYGPNGPTGSAGGW